MESSEEVGLNLDLGKGVDTKRTREEGSKCMRLERCPVRLNLFELEDLAEGK